MGVPLNIDWQQILLHMFNLIILTGGLYFLLYQPVTAFMKKRQEYYAGLEADAQAKLQEAEQKVRDADETLSGMLAEAEQLRADAMKQADAEAAARLAGADAEKQKILAAAKAQAARELLISPPDSPFMAIKPTSCRLQRSTSAISRWPAR